MELPSDLERRIARRMAIKRIGQMEQYASHLRANPTEVADNINRFVRGDSSRSRAAGSTGLGLAIVAAVVTAHHGSVSVDSRPGKTTFTVQLPHSEVAADRPTTSVAAARG